MAPADCTSAERPAMTVLTGADMRCVSLCCLALLAVMYRLDMQTRFHNLQLFSTVIPVFVMLLVLMFVCHAALHKAC